MATEYSWPVFPVAMTGQFEARARMALEQWRLNSAMMAATLEQCQEDIAAINAKMQNYQVIQAVAGENIEALKCVYIDQSTAKVYKTDSTYTEKSTTCMIEGITITSASANQAISVQMIGIVEGFTGLTLGTLYLSTDGDVTSTAPDNERVIGVANTTTSILLSYSNNIVISWSEFGYAMGGGLANSTTTATTDKLTYSTDTTGAQSSANLTSARYIAAAVSAAQDGYAMGGCPATGTTTSICNRVTYNSDTTATVSSGALSLARSYPTGQSASTKGYVIGGSATSGWVATSDKITFSTETTVAQSSANSSVARLGAAGISAPTKGYTSGGEVNGYSVTALTDVVNFSTDVNGAVSAAALTLAREGVVGIPGSTKGYALGGGNIAGNNYSNAAERVVYASNLYSAVVSAYLSSARALVGSITADSHGYILGGAIPSTVYTTADKLVFSTDTTAACSSANLSVARSGVCGISGYNLASKG